MASTLETFLTSIDEHFVPIVRVLYASVQRACGDFDVAIKYRMLTYTFGRDYRVCAIGVTRKAVNLRFLYGVMLDDSRG